MRIEARQFVKSHNPLVYKRQLLLICENEEESVILDGVFGNEVGKDGFIASVEGEVRLSDGYAEHYIRIEKKK